MDFEAINFFPDESPRQLARASQ